MSPTVPHGLTDEERAALPGRVSKLESNLDTLRRDVADEFKDMRSENRRQTEAILAKIEAQGRDFAEAQAEALRKGQFSAQDELDLHGATASQAEALLRQFLAEAHAHEFGCVRIVHGKGLQSGGVPLLKNLVDRLLRQRNDVLAFHSAPTAQGGTGAMLVLLARR